MRADHGPRALFASTGALWTAVAFHKGGVFLFQFQLGRLGGTRALGVMASVLTLAWLVGTSAGLGLPDWATFKAAEDAAADRPLRREAHRAHALFVVLILSSHVGLLWLAPSLGGAVELGGFARLLVVGAGGQALGAFALSALRGQGRPALEVGIHLSGALILLVTTALARQPAQLAMGWALNGVVFGSGAFVGLIWEPGLLPEGGRMEGWWALARGSLPYLALGLLAWLLGNLDLLLGRWGCPPEDVGRLQAGTVLLRAGSAAPWILATLLLHRRAGGCRWWGPLCIGVGLAVVIGALAWWGLPWVAWGYGVEQGILRQPTALAALCAPWLYALLAILPLAVARSLRRTLLVAGAGVMVAVLVGAVLVTTWGISGAIVAAATGQAVALLGLTLRPSDGSASAAAVG